jgi:DNA invertase Pin-like site-specific DNA recombinase
MEQTVYAYGLSKSQTAEHLAAELAGSGVEKENIFIDSLNGSRSRFANLLDVLKPGDSLVIKSLGHLGHSADEVSKAWMLLTAEKKLMVRVLNMPILNVTQPGDPLSALVRELVATLLSHIAESDREFKAERQKEGILEAKARGVKFGRERMEIPNGFAAVKTMYVNGEISLREGARILGVNRGTFKGWLDADAMASAQQDEAEVQLIS